MRPGLRAVTALGASKYSIFFARVRRISVETYRQSSGTLLSHFCRGPRASVAQSSRTLLSVMMPDIQTTSERAAVAVRARQLDDIRTDSGRGRGGHVARDLDVCPARPQTPVLTERGRVL